MKLELTPPPDLEEAADLAAVEEHITLSNWLRARRHEPQSVRRRAMERVRERHRLAKARNAEMELG